MESRFPRIYFALPKFSGIAKTKLMSMFNNPVIHLQYVEYSKNSILLSTSVATEGLNKAFHVGLRGRKSGLRTQKQMRNMNLKARPFKYGNIKFTLCLCCSSHSRFRIHSAGCVHTMTLQMRDSQKWSSNDMQNQPSEKRQLYDTHHLR